MSENNCPAPLGATGRDRAVAVARAVAGMVPVAGSLIAELITEVVPGQRQERVEDWLRHLAERLATVEEARLRERLREPENVALFEEGAYQATQAISEERRRQIAELVAGGIADERRDYLESHRVLRLLGELDDAEVVILAGYLKKNVVGNYWARHASVLCTPRVSHRSGTEEIDMEAVRRAGGDHLLRLGLLREITTYRLASDPAPPAGAPARSAYVSPLGRLLLKRGRPCERGRPVALRGRSMVRRFAPWGTLASRWVWAGGGSPARAAPRALEPPGRHWWANKRAARKTAPSLVVRASLLTLARRAGPLGT